MVALKLAVAAATLFASTAIAAIDPIVIKGSKFFYKTNGTEFFMRGIAYQQDVGGNETTSGDGGPVNFVDPLTDVEGCKRDIPLLTQLRTNTIRVYAIDPTKSHDECMSMLADAGIYLVADLSAPNISINRDTPSWDDQLYARYTSVIDTLQKYDNVLGFFAGNEVSNNASNVDAIPFVKAAVRDMKAYIKRKGYRSIGVGYAADDDATIRAPLRNYMNCGSADESVDFFGYNIYSWCGSDSSFKISGYADRTKEFSDYSVPAFFAEYGCNKPSPRVFDETLALYSSDMTGVWSGGIVYQWFQSENNYGLIELNGNSADKLKDFTALSKQIAKTTPTGVKMDSYTPTNTKLRSCPTSTENWVAATKLPPTPNEELCSCMVKSLQCVATSDINPDDIGDLFGTACDPSNGKDICDGIARNGTTGDFGVYSMCSAQQQLSWAFNAYFQQQAKSNSANTNACSFGGKATRQDAQQASGSCGSLLAQAGPAGTGVVTSVPTTTGAGSAESSGAAGLITIPSLNFGAIKLSAYITVAFMAGAGMILL